MKFAILNFLLLFYTFSFSQESIIGEWQLNPEGASKLIFYKDGKFELVINGNIVSAVGSEELKFLSERINEENWIHVSNKSNVPFLRFKYEIDNCNLLVVFYKSGNKIDHDIDEIGWYKKTGCNAVLSKPVHTQTFIIPDYFAGDAYINYTGEQIRKENSSTFKFPSSGVLNLSFKAEPFDLLRGGLIFLTTQGDTIKQFLIGNEPTYKSNLNQKERFIKIIGFNQTGREDLESKFGINDKIRDVLLIKISSLNEPISKE